MLWVILPVAEVVVFVTSAWSLRVLSINWGKVINWGSANPCKEGNPNVHGFKSCWYHSPHEISVEDC